MAVFSGYENGRVVVVTMVWSHECEHTVYSDMAVVVGNVCGCMFVA